MSATVRVLSGVDVERALAMETAVEAVRHAFVQLSAGGAEVPLRTVMPLADSGTALFMPAGMATGDHFGLKVVTVVPDNVGRDLPTIQALVTLFDAATGVPEAVMDGEVLTAIRTGAASGVATDLLARRDSSVVAVIGAGVQARRQVEAVCCVRTIREVLIFDADATRALQMAEELGDDLMIPVRVLHRTSAVGEADVICTATSSDTPVLLDRDVAPGTHINAIGTYRPDTREIPGETVARSRLVVDSRSACRAEAGELVMAIEEGLLDGEVEPDEIGEIAAGLKPARSDDRQITLFKSVGNAVQDLAVAGVVLTTAQRLGLGTEVTL
jgi:ornithine cyclodeaminase/alanine dehydrogenase-like protein (mu-crystallin family)